MTVSLSSYVTTSPSAADPTQRHCHSHTKLPQPPRHNHLFQIYTLITSCSATLLASTAVLVNTYIERVKRILCLLNFQEVQIKRLTTVYIFRRLMTLGGSVDLLKYTINYIQYIVQISAAYVCLRNKTKNICSVK